MVQVPLFLVFLVLSIGARVLLRRPWLVEAANESQTREWKVVGWRRSGQVVREIADAIQLGQRVIEPEGAQPISPL